MIEVIRAAAELQAVCEVRQWKYCFIGGLALQRWGEPRETVDVDLTLLTGFGGEQSFIDVLLNWTAPFSIWESNCDVWLHWILPNFPQVEKHFGIPLSYAKGVIAQSPESRQRTPGIAPNPVASYTEGVAAQNHNEAPDSPGRRRVFRNLTCAATPTA